VTNGSKFLEVADDGNKWPFVFADSNSNSNLLLFYKYINSLPSELSNVTLKYM
jgi:hypothetical protein